MTEQERKDILEYKATLALYKRTCQEEYRSAHPNCMTCELCKDREYSFRKCAVTEKEVGCFNWTRIIRAKLCKYYTPHIDQQEEEKYMWTYARG